MTKTVAKAFAGVIVSMVALGMTFTPVMAAELDLQLLIQLLTSGASDAEIIAALTGGSTSTGSTEMVASGLVYNGITYRRGMSNAQPLQDALNFCGGFNLVVDGSFGPATENAVRSWQSQNGLVADGIAGMNTIKSLETCAVMVPGGSSSDDNMDDDDDNMDDNDSNDDVDFQAGGGEEATTKDFDIDNADDTSIEEGTEDAVLAEFDFENEDSAILVERFDIIFDAGATNDEKNPWDVFEKIWVEYDGDVLVSNSDADDDDEWDELDSANAINRIRLSGAELVLPADEKTDKFMIMADINSSVDMATAADWVVYVAEGTADTDGVRYLDEAGITGYIGSTTDTASFSIVNEGQEDELKASTSNDDPDATTLEVKQSTKSDEYEVFVFELEADEDGSDLEIDDVYIDVTVGNPTGSAVTPSASTIIADARLVIDGQSEDYTGTPSAWSTTIAAGATQVVSFQFDFDKDVVIDSGDTVDAKFYLEFNSQQSTPVYVDGTTVLASADPDGTTDWNVEGSDDLTASQLTGAATGETHTLFKDGIIVDFDKATATSETIDGDDNDYAELTIMFDVEAFGSDFYVPNTTTQDGGNITNTATFTAAPTAADGVNYHIQTNGGTSPVAVATTATLTSTADEKTNSFLVEEGNKETFTLKITVANAATNLLDAQSVRAILGGIGFATTDTATGTLLFTSNLTNDYKTDYTYIAN